MVTAAQLRGEASFDPAGRRRQFGQMMDVSPFARYVSPYARSVMDQQWFDPLSSRYLLATMPSVLGGAGTELPAGRLGDFASFLGYGDQPMLQYQLGTPYFAAEGQEPASPRVAGTYYTPTTGNPLSSRVTSGQWAPWSRSQWADRLAALNLPTTAAGMPAWERDLAGAADWITGEGGITPEEAESMIQSAAFSGINPIARRVLTPQLSRAFANWELGGGEGGLDMGGAEMLRRFLYGGPTARSGDAIGGFLQQTTDAAGQPVYTGRARTGWTPRGLM
jgi:hypothetical protein